MLIVLSSGDSITKYARQLLEHYRKREQASLPRTGGELLEVGMLHAASFGWNATENLLGELAQEFFEALYLLQEEGDFEGGWERWEIGEALVAVQGWSGLPAKYRTVMAERRRALQAERRRANKEAHEKKQRAHDVGRAKKRIENLERETEQGIAKLEAEFARWRTAADEAHRQAVAKEEEKLRGRLAKLRARADQKLAALRERL